MAGTVNSPSNVHVSAPLTNVVIGYNNGRFIADEVCPVVNVLKESDKFYKWDRGNGFRLPSTRRTDGGSANLVEFKVSTDSYTAEEYALKAKIGARAKRNADSVLRLKISKSKYLKDLLMLDREKRVATLLTTLANWDGGSGGTTLSGVNQWSNASFAGSIESDIDTGKEYVRARIGAYPTHIIIPAAVAQVVKRDPTIRELIKYTQNDLLVNGDLPPTMFNMKVLVPTAVNITSADGASSTTTADVWGDDVVMLWLPQGANELDMPSAVKTFRARNWETREWFNDEENADYVETGIIDDEKVTSNISGYVIKAAIA